MILKLNEINKSKIIPINLDLDRFNETYKVDNIKRFKAIEGEVKVTKLDKVNAIKFDFDTDLELISTFSLKVFNKTFHIEDEIYVTNDKEYESEETIYFENSIDLENLIFSLIITNLPISIKAPDEDKIEGDGYRVLKEEDLLNEEDESSPFDVLDGLDFDD